MADIPLYAGDTVLLRWGQVQWQCQVWRSDELCGTCGGATVRLEPPWDTWTLLCCAESALTTTRVQREAAVNSLQPGAIGMVSAVPVRLEKITRPSQRYGLWEREEP